MRSPFRNLTLALAGIVAAGAVAAQQSPTPAREAPAFLVLKFDPATAEGTVAEWASAVEAAKGLVLAAAPATRIKTLEPGSLHTALVLARFERGGDLDAFWSKAASRATPDLVALAATGLPWEGLPGSPVPTVASVQAPDLGAPTYMLIEGSSTDQDRIRRYRETIAPMLRGHGAYYVLAASGTTRVLSGSWNEVVLTISRWPSRARAEGFWNSDAYQREGVPIRTGISRYHVQIVEGRAG